MTFDATVRDSWPDVLTLAQCAAIYQTTPEAIRHAMKPHRERVCPYPRPFLRYPMRFRKTDVIRHVEGVSTGGSSRSPRWGATTAQHPVHRG